MQRLANQAQSRKNPYFVIEDGRQPPDMVSRQKAGNSIPEHWKDKVYGTGGGKAEGWTGGGVGLTKAVAVVRSVPAL